MAAVVEARGPPGAWAADAARPANSFERVQLDFAGRRRAQFEELNQLMSEVNVDLFSHDSPARGSAAPQMRLLGAIPPTIDSYEGKLVSKKAMAAMVRAESQSAAEVIAQQREPRSARGSRHAAKGDIESLPGSARDITSPSPAPASSVADAQDGEPGDVVDDMADETAGEVVAASHMPDYVAGTLSARTPLTSRQSSSTDETERILTKHFREGPSRTLLEEPQPAPLDWEGALCGFYEHVESQRGADWTARALRMHEEEQARRRRQVERRRIEAAHLKKETALAYQYLRLETSQSHARRSSETCRKLQRAERAEQAVADQVRMSAARRRDERTARQRAVEEMRLFTQKQLTIDKTCRAVDVWKVNVNYEAAAYNKAERVRTKDSEKSHALVLRNAHLEGVRSARIVQASNKHRAQVQVAKERDDHELEQRRQKVAEEKERRTLTAFMQMQRRIPRKLAERPSTARTPVQDAEVEVASLPAAAPAPASSAVQKLIPNMESFSVVSEEAMLGGPSSEMRISSSSTSLQAEETSTGSQSMTLKRVEPSQQVPLPLLPSVVEPKPFCDSGALRLSPSSARSAVVRPSLGEAALNEMMEGALAVVAASSPQHASRVSTLNLRAPWGGHTGTPP